jgi:hypothetical protein
MAQPWDFHGYFSHSDHLAQPEKVKSDHLFFVPDPRCGAEFTGRRAHCDHLLLSRTIFVHRKTAETEAESSAAAIQLFCHFCGQKWVWASARKNAFGCRLRKAERFACPTSQVGEFWPGGLGDSWQGWRSFRLCLRTAFGGCSVPDHRRSESQKKRCWFPATTSHFLFVNKSWRLVRQDGYRQQSLTFRTGRHTAVPGPRQVSVPSFPAPRPHSGSQEPNTGPLFCLSNFWERFFLLFIATQSLRCHLG